MSGTTPQAWLGLDAAAARDRVLARVRPWVEIETPSRDEVALTALSRRIEEEVRALGATTHAFHAPGFGRNLRADFSGSDATLAPLVVLAHIDTVHPQGTLATLPFRVLEDRAEGPGIYDMKTGLALAVEAVAWLHGRGRTPRRPLIFLITCDEEIGSHSARSLFQAAADVSYAALVPEPSMADGSVKTARKGVSTYALEIEGRAAHAGVEPEKAVSAVRELAELLPRIHALEDRAAGTTINVGVIHAGTASNVVPARAVAEIDVRAVVSAEAERVHAHLLALRALHPEANVHVSRVEQRGPLVRTPGVVQLYQHARDIATQWDVALGEGMTGGGSDGSLMAELGLPVLDGLGARGGGAHARDEHVLLEDLPFRLALMAALFETL